MAGSNRRTPRFPAALVLVAAAVAGCGGGSDNAQHARYANGASASTTLLRGTVASVAPGELAIRTATSTVTLKLTQPLHVYHRQAGSLADVKDDAFIGVTTVKQPDGSERATEIHVFPEALRGLGEGSRMMTQNPNGGSRMTNGAVSGSRMTNGAVSGSRMTNGAVSGSRMTNGGVARANGSSLVVQFAGGSLKVTVPPGTPVTVLGESPKPLAQGDQVVVPATRGPDGSLSTNKVLLSGK